jgi:hypothetical protein
VILREADPPCQCAERKALIFTFVAVSVWVADRLLGD